MGTLVVPGGLALPVYVFSFYAFNGSGGFDVITFASFILLAVAPLITTAYLALQMRRGRELAAA